MAKRLSVNLTVYLTYGFMATSKPQKNVIKTHDSESRGQEEAAIIRETKKNYATTDYIYKENRKENC